MPYMPISWGGLGGQCRHIFHGVSGYSRIYRGLKSTKNHNVALSRASAIPIPLLMNQNTAEARLTFCILCIYIYIYIQICNGKKQTHLRANLKPAKHSQAKGWFPNKIEIFCCSCSIDSIVSLFFFLVLLLLLLVVAVIESFTFSAPIPLDPRVTQTGSPVIQGTKRLHRYVPGLLCCGLVEA